MIVRTEKGTPVRFWKGIREGDGRTGTLGYDGIHEVGGTQCVYVSGHGAIALSHIEEIVPMAAPTQNQPDYEAQRAKCERLASACEVAARQWRSGHPVGHDAILELHRALKGTTPELRREVLELKAELATLKQQLARASANEESVIQDEAHDRDEMALLVKQKDAVIVSLATAGRALLNRIKMESGKIGFRLDTGTEENALQQALADAQTGTETGTYAFPQPAIGNVLDRWEQLPNDIRSDPGFDALNAALTNLYHAVILAGTKGEPHE